ncbi:MAG: alpha/beta hydrolase [Labilithrix sp.]|nr:alpha/beta hydrolase [Labilithrix sp.]MCW5834105.1 alpha/beta hydrolase [Labilithrix sp.]
MALDNATATFLAKMAEGGGKALHEMTVGEARGLTAHLRTLYGKGPEVDRIEEVRVETATGPFPSRVVVPRGEVRGVLVWYHGGGWVIGAMDDFDTLVRKLAVRTKCAVLQVDYRMAPEHRFPTAADDAYAALEWAAANVGRVTGGPTNVPIVVGGDSAGGNLSAVVARRARDRGGPRIAMQLLVYPVTDADFERPTYVAKENQLMLSRDSMVWFWDHYAPRKQDRLSPDASPLRATDLSRLPPAVVVTAEHDVLRDEGEDYAKALEAAGVDVTFKRFEGQMHGFFTMVNVLPGADAGLEYVASALDRQLAKPNGSARSGS